MPRAPTWCTPTPGTRTSPGFTAKLLHGIPHVVTAHSLEPLRPWKAEQLGGGYRLSSLGRAHGVRGRRRGHRRERRHAPRHPARLSRRSTPRVCEVVYNGIDLDATGSPITTPSRARRSGSTPTVRRWSSSGASRGRRACRTCCARRELLPADVQLVLCAGAPDTRADHGRGRPASSTSCSDDARAAWSGSTGSCRATSSRALLTAATDLRLPVGLRAARHREPRGDGVRRPGRRHGDRRHPRGRRRRRHRACSCRSSRREDGTGTPLDPDAFVADLAAALTRVVSDPGARARDGSGGPAARGGRLRWDAIAERTRELYERVLAG